MGAYALLGSTSTLGRLARGISFAEYPAQIGNFSEAMETPQRSLQLATAQNNTALEDALRTEIDLYQKGFPCRNGK
jgi:hypothetical protein